MNHKKNPNISIVLCTYNGELYLREQLNSILKQTLPASEIIIQDDCSTDNTWDIILEYKSKYPIIKAFRNQKNIRAHANFISAFSLATGDFIAPSDQDDIWYETKIEVLYNSIGNNSLSFSNEKILYEDGSLVNDNSTMKPINQLIWGNNLKGHTFLFKKELLSVYKFAGKFISFDYCLALNASITGDYVFVDDFLSIWRRHKDVCTSSVLLNIHQNNELSGSWEKTFFSIKSISMGIRSEVINNFFLDRVFFIKGISDNSLKMNLIIRLLVCVARQTLLSMLMAGFYNVLLLKYENDFNELSFRNKIGSISFRFRTPLMYWNDMYKEKALE